MQFGMMDGSGIGYGMMFMELIWMSLKKWLMLQPGKDIMVKKQRYYIP